MAKDDVKQYDSPVRPRPNFGDPTFEPTDGQLEELSREAFAGVAERHRAALTRLRTEIAEMRAAALARVATPPVPSESTG